MVPRNPNIPPWEDWSSSEDWTEEEKLQATRESSQRTVVERELRHQLAEQLGVSEAEAEAILLMRQLGWKDAREVAHALDQHTSPSDGFYFDVVRALDAYRAALPWWKRPFA